MKIMIFATLISFYVKGLCGFANTLVFTSILSFHVENKTISPVELLLSYPTNLLLVLKNRKFLNLKAFLPLSCLVLIGSILGTFVLKNSHPRFIKIIFGFAIITLGIESLFRKKTTLPSEHSKIFLSSVSILSGIFCGLFGIGALLAIYFKRTTNSSREFKANLNAVFFVENTFRIFLYISHGLFPLSNVGEVSFLFPFMSVGLFAGIKSGELFKEHSIKNLVSVFLIFSGLALLLKSK